MARYFDVHPENPQARSIAQIVAILREGGVIAYPTDSGFALGAMMGNQQALARIREIRHLDERHHFTLVCADFAQLGQYAVPSNAMFRMPFVDLGLVPEAGSSLLVPQTVGLRKASEFLLLGDGFGAEEAHRLGIVNAVLPPDELIGVATERAHRLASKPRNAIATTRRLLRGDRDALLARIDEEALLFGKALRSDEAKAAFTAFMSKAKK